MHLLRELGLPEVKKDSKNLLGLTFEFWIKIFGASKLKEWLNSWQCLNMRDKLFFFLTCSINMLIRSLFQFFFCFTNINIVAFTGKLTWLKRIEVKKDKVRTNVFKNIYKTISDKILQLKRFNAFSIIISL